MYPGNYPRIFLFNKNSFRRENKSGIVKSKIGCLRVQILLIM